MSQRYAFRAHGLPSPAPIPIAMEPPNSTTATATAHHNQWKRAINSSQSRTPAITSTYPMN